MVGDSSEPVLGHSSCDLLCWLILKLFLVVWGKEVYLSFVFLIAIRGR
jgi:hypothetical protein